ncbi:MAG: hypothetical protein ACPGU1_16185 [Myxococcota bacterium]
MMDSSPRVGRIEALSRAFKADPWLWPCMLISVIAAVVPLWSSELLPFMDLPQHLATIRIMTDIGLPAFAPYYDTSLGSTQYLGYYYLVQALGALTDLETGNRLALSLYAIALPLSVAAYMKAFGRDMAVALLAVPFVFNTFLFMGFANYLLAIPLIFFGLAMLRALMDDFSAWRCGALSLVVVALFYSHVHAFLIYGLAAGLVGLFAGRGFHPRHWWRPATHLIPSLVLMGVWMQRSLILAGDEAWRTGHGGRNVSPVEMRWEPLLDRFTAIPRQLLDTYRDDSDERILLALLGLTALLLLFRRFAPSAEEISEYGASRAWLRARTPEIIVAAMAVTYVLSPISYKWIWPISHRMVPVVALFALGMLAWRRLPLRPALLLVPMTALNLWACQVHVDHVWDFDDEAGAVREVVAEAEPGKRVLGLIFDRGSRVVNHAPYLHFAQYYVVERGGVASFSFVDFPQSPVAYQEATAPPRLPNRFEWTPERFRFRTHGGYYDYFLVRDAPSQAKRRPFGKDADKVTLVTRQGRWALYKRK